MRTSCEIPLRIKNTEGQVCPLFGGYSRIKVNKCICALHSHVHCGPPSLLVHQLSGLCLLVFATVLVFKNQIEIINEQLKQAKHSLTCTKLRSEFARCTYVKN